MFRDVTFSARGGESWAITGPNGIGKSSLLSIIAKYRIPSEGKLTYEPASVAFAWQSPHVHPPADLHVRDIVRDWQRYKPSEINSDFYDRWKLPAHKPLHMLSSGMRQRLLVGLTLSLTTGIILLDEPTAHLDEDYRKQIQSEIVSRMTNPELLVVCATNDPNEAALFPRILNLKEYAA
ncbi:MAG: ABC transporter ATP-binding protein [Bacteroidia bacterium]|nr:ABC transporter ATP-binding protein [Bacteroidia bacterium]MCX7652276.1 ABC transporter ATP-binding protein [Bacteroidia bacterium]MDW8416538.1 ABC transporter ATP-binding protein [Bacteroidia bacterium]